MTEAIGTKARLMSRQEVADFLRISKRTLDDWAYRGTGPRYIRAGRNARYDPADVARWCEQHKSVDAG